MRFIGRNNRAKSSSGIAKAKVSYKENVGILKDTLDVVWKLSPILLIPAGLLLWTYLQSFGWTSLFYEAAMSGLVFLVVAAVVSAIFVCLLFVIPSAIVIATAQYYDANRIIPLEVIGLHRAALLAWLLVVFLAAAFGNQIPTWSIFLLPVAVASLYGEKKLDKLQLMRGESFPGLAAHGQVLVLASLATISMCGTSFALLITFNVASQFGDVVGWKMVADVAICIFMSMVGVVPGFMYLNMRTRHKGHYKPTKMALFGTVTVAYVLFSAVAFLPQAQSMFLRTAGVYVESRTTFQILKPDLVPAFSAAGLEIKQVAAMSTVTACVRYSFAGTRLLCRDPFDPSSADADAVKEARQHNLKNPKIIGGLHCVPTVSGELREFRNEAPDPMPESCGQSRPATR